MNETTPTLTLTEFLLARIAEDEAAALSNDVADRPHGDRCELLWMADHYTPECSCRYPARVLAECEAKRRIVEWHKNWPVLTNTKPVFAEDVSVGSMTFRMSQEMAWMTEQQYRDRFGEEPPTGPILRILAGVYADHSDYDEAWRP